MLKGMARKVLVFTNKVREVFSPAYRQSKIDVVTGVTVGKTVQQLAEEATELLTGRLEVHNTDVANAEEEHANASARLFNAMLVRDNVITDLNVVSDLARK